MNIEIPALNFAAIMPQSIVIFTALVVLVAELISPPGRRRHLAYLSLFGVFVAAVASVIVWDGRAPAFQKMAVADGYALFLNVVFLVTAALSLLLSAHYLEREGIDQGEYYALLLFATAGMMIMGAATDLMTVFLGLEILSIPLYVLAGFNREKQESGEAALKYFLLGAFASGFLLYGMALVYGATGTTNLAGIVAQASGQGNPLLVIGAGLLIVGFGFKVALVPFHMWTPDVYQGAPTSVTAFMSVGAKAAGFAALGRVLVYALGGQAHDWSPLLAALAVLTMTLGNVVAVSQTNLKRMLAYSSIAHAGYIIIGVAAANSSGGAALLFYLLAYAFMNIGAFGVVIAVCESRPLGFPKPQGSLEDYAGLSSRHPFLAAAMAIFMLSLAGVPPLAGFWGKLYVFSAAMEAGLAVLAVVGVINSVISAYFYLRVIVYMYLRPSSGKASPTVVPGALVAATILAVLGTVLLGLWPSPLVGLAQRSIMAMLGG